MLPFGDKGAESAMRNANQALETISSMLCLAIPWPHMPYKQSTAAA